MRTQSKDTHPKIEAALIAMLRNASLSQKFAQIRSLSQVTLSLSRRAIARKNDVLSEDDVNWLFVKYHYGKDLADRFRDYMKKRSHEKS
jgi:hypothetical protein